MLPVCTHTLTCIVYPIRKLSAASASSDATQALPLTPPRRTPRRRSPASHLAAGPKATPNDFGLDRNERMNGLCRAAGWLPFSHSPSYHPPSNPPTNLRNFASLIFDFGATFYCVCVSARCKWESCLNRRRSRQKGTFLLGYTNASVFTDNTL